MLTTLVQNLWGFSDIALTSIIHIFTIILLAVWILDWVKYKNKIGTTKHAWLLVVGLIFSSQHLTLPLGITWMCTMILSYVDLGFTAFLVAQVFAFIVSAVFAIVLAEKALLDLKTLIKARLQLY